MLPVLSKEENIFPCVVDVVALILSLHGSQVVLAFLEALVVADCQNNT